MRAVRAIARIVIAGLLVGALAGPVYAADPPAERSTEERARKTQNPVADLISVPFQNDFDVNAGPRERMVYLLNVQPVIPFHLTEDWNLITRIIMPIADVPSLAPGVPNASGLGDINPSVFLSPAKTEHLICGVGPTFTFPTASAGLLGSGKWSTGPTGVALYMDGPWVAGALANNQWSYAGWSDKAVTSCSYRRSSTTTSSTAGTCRAPRS